MATHWGKATVRREGTDDGRRRPITGSVVLAIIMVLVAAMAVWILHIPINLNSREFWLEVGVIAALGSICGCAIYDQAHGNIPFSTIFELWTGTVHPSVIPYRTPSEASLKRRPYLRYAAVAFILLFLLGPLIGSPIFSAHAWASRMVVTPSTFEEWADDLRVEGISLMDTDSATMVGNRELGSLQDVVSQYDDAQYYQVILNGTPQKVAPLQYVTFFSWLHNRSVGAPGYVLVDPIRQNADYHKLEAIDGTGDGLRFVPSARLWDNLERRLWMQYPTKVLDEPHFELDDEGRPFYVTQTFGFKSLMGAPYVNGIIVTDPTDGTSTLYAVDEVPAWLDVVYDGDLLDEMYDDYGALSGGFLNSIFGQIGCTRTGGDYGYVMIGDEQWIYTGITSMGGDSSNVGFLLASEKTGTSYFLPMASADENSAMQSAEGKVQQYGYRASFPSLVSIDGQPTYVMVLKDGGGLIRLYAMVNAESYNVVACEGDLVLCKASYEQAMRAAGIEFGGDEQEMPEVDAGDTTGGAGQESKMTDVSAEVAALQMADDGGNTYLYVLTTEGDVLRIRFADDPAACMTMKVGDKVRGRGVALADGTIDMVELN